MTGLEIGELISFSFDMFLVSICCIASFLYGYLSGVRNASDYKKDLEDAKAVILEGSDNFNRVESWSVSAQQLKDVTNAVRNIVGGPGKVIDR